MVTGLRKQRFYAKTALLEVKERKMPIPFIALFRAVEGLGSRNSIWPCSSWVLSRGPQQRSGFITQVPEFHGIPTASPIFLRLLRGLRMESRI